MSWNIWSSQLIPVCITSYQTFGGDFPLHGSKEILCFVTHLKVLVLLMAPAASRHELGGCQYLKRLDVLQLKSWGTTIFKMSLSTQSNNVIGSAEISMWRTAGREVWALCPWPAADGHGSLSFLADMQDWTQRPPRFPTNFRRGFSLVSIAPDPGL